MKAFTAGAAAAAPDANACGVNAKSGHHWYAESRRWPAGDIIVAALAERVRTRDAPFEGVNSERLAAGLFECWHTAVGDHAGLKQLAPKLEAELQVLPHLPIIPDDLPIGIEGADVWNELARSHGEWAGGAQKRSRMK